MILPIQQRLKETKTIKSKYWVVNAPARTSRQIKKISVVKEIPMEVSLETFLEKP
ncbi:hypothetical protein MYP_1913 [Sporocytophaga myxococcoides]|uniref:Uncharacterized protein n=1 Tax=Sporocytophaga myxococcoides TaxID=153721 RepID=A0A098LCH6_9BACT|nr:hypothetical protein MYP_1913 [Sporocytophaga myxococcoides]